MRSRHIRAFGLLVGLVAVLGMASIATGESLTDQQISRQINRRLSEDAFSNVNVSVQASVVSLSGTVPSLWAKNAAIAKARDLSDVTSVVSDALDIERAESDRVIVEQIAKDIWRVSIPGPAAAARPRVTTAPGIAESQRPSGRFGRHDTDAGFGHAPFGRFPHPRSHVDHDHVEHLGPDADLHGLASVDFSHHLDGVGPHGFTAQRKLQDELDQALYAHSGNAFYGIFDYVAGWVEDGVVALTGYVTHDYKASKMVEFVSRVAGVKEIQNQVEVLPVSALDDRLRVSLATNIYGNPLFWNDATRLVPPVHIIVDNLRVTLSGVVFSEVEKRVAADTVRQTPGVLSFQNNLDLGSPSNRTHSATGGSLAGRSILSGFPRTSGGVGGTVRGRRPAMMSP